MDQKPVSCGGSGSEVCYQLPPLSAKYPWLVAHGTEDQTFYTVNDQLCRYRCQIPELIGRNIRGHFHGWVVLSNRNNVMWSIWNPVTGKIIHLPPLILKDESYESGLDCCLSSPPDDPSSVLLLTRTAKPTFIFCRLDYKRKGLEWNETSYAKQLKRIVGYDGFLKGPTIFNGKVYALHTGYNHLVIQVNIVVKDSGVLLKNAQKKTLGNVYLFKWDMTTSMRLEQMEKKDRKDYMKTSMMWEEMVDLKDALFFVDLSRDYSIFYRRAIASELGGYVHIHYEMCNMIYSYDFQDKTISLSSSKLSPSSHLSLWEGVRLEGEAKWTQEKDDNDDKKTIMIMELCVGVEYMHFRATCKRCHLAAPLIQWSNKTSLASLKRYSVASPWLMVVDKNRGFLTFTDPMFGDKYFMKKLEVSVSLRYEKICCSRYGWLLFYSSYFGSDRDLVFFNPFTNDIRKLPHVGRYLDTCSFSASPTSPNCMVIGFTLNGEPQAYIHSVGRERFWRMLRLGPDPYPICFPTFYSQDVYALCKEGELYVLKNFAREDYSWEQVVAARTSSCPFSPQQFLVKRDQHLLLVTVGKFGEYVEVFKLNNCAKEWEKIDCLGRHMIYISGRTCLCIEAKTPEMENKIYFPRLHSKNGKIVFYSLETSRYHTFSGKNIIEDVTYGLEHVYPHTWIEPSWS
ncbi:hypothetical protein CTI12_AA355820 [Artemisia annua]|uniref:KIB1-4 beta-propeller domain-containing protein n=1 Tax=Artemisia annua TaxID=35608 RepID=A0A2U1MQ91_ARTAN|nr:hypothetical protein CTI12_AA355820 [Artemisia annua]